MTHGALLGVHYQVRPECPERDPTGPRASHTSNIIWYSQRVLCHSVEHMILHTEDPE